MQILIPPACYHPCIIRRRLFQAFILSKTRQMQALQETGHNKKQGALLKSDFLHIRHIFANWTC